MKLSEDLLRKIFVSAFIVIVVLFKISLFPFESTDYTEIFEHWLNFITANGYISSMKYKFYDYSPLYVYYFVIISKLFHSEEWLSMIKILSITFDLILGYYVYLIVKLKTKDLNWSTLAFCVTIALPTVAINGALWGQCDVIYTTFTVMAIYYIMKGKNVIAFLMLGLAFSFKLQSIFIYPLLGLLLFSNFGIRMWHFLLIPIVYFITLLPAYNAGCDMDKLLFSYFDQAFLYDYLNIGAPSIYSFLPNYYDLLSNSGILFAIIAVLILMFSHLILVKSIDHEQVLTYSFLFVLLVPFFLPCMHERYFFMADIFSLIYCFALKRNYYYFILLQFISSNCIITVFHIGPAIETKYLAIIVMVILYQLMKEIFKTSIENRNLITSA